MASSTANVLGPDTGLTKNQIKKQLELADDYFKMKEFYYGRYMSQLREKVIELDEKHQRELKRNTQRLNRQTNKPVQRRKTFSADRVKPSQPLPSIQKSRKYLMIEAEENVKKAGIENSLEQWQEFREQLKSAQDIQSFVDAYITKRIREMSSKKSRSARQRPLSKIAETRENSAGLSRPSTQSKSRKSAKSTKNDLNPLAGNKQLSPSEIARAAAHALEERCPRMPIPDMYCLRPKVEEDDGELEQIEEENRQKVKDYNSFKVANVRKMYQRAQANIAQARRIQEKTHENSGSVVDMDADYKISDLEAVLQRYQSDTESYLSENDYPDYRTYIDLLNTPDQSENRLSNIVQSDDSQVNQSEPSVGGIIKAHTDFEQELMNSRHLNQYNQYSFTPIEEEPSDYKTHRSLVPVTKQPETESPVTRKRIEDILGGEGLRQLVPVDQTPSIERQNTLSLRDMQNEVKVIEAKALSTYWNNYLKVGKSKFSKDES